MVLTMATLLVAGWWINRPTVVFGAPLEEPGGTPADAVAASQHPDEYAWQLFLFLNRQAKAGEAGTPDDKEATIRDYDDDKPVVWETWGLSSGLVLDSNNNVVTDKSEVFKIPATPPVSWDQLDRTVTPKILTPNLKSLAVALALQPSTHFAEFQIQIAPPGTSPADDESRMNRSTYETVRTHRLYSVEGIQAAIAAAKSASNKSVIDFESKSKEIKARWVHLSDCDSNAHCADRNRYHWRSIVVNGQSQIWGLASLHIITKDLPNWFWADFSHVDCEKAVGACKDESEGAQTPTRDSTVPSGGARPETQGSKWSNYVLRGTEIDFNLSNGVKNILSNPVIEKGFQNSSCMTCHAYASAALIGAGGVPNTGTSLALIARKTGTPNVGSRSFDIGTPDCWRFYTPRNLPTGNCPGAFDKTQPLYFQSDFLWSIPFRAFSEKP